MTFSCYEFYYENSWKSVFIAQYAEEMESKILWFVDRASLYNLVK